MEIKNGIIEDLGAVMGAEATLRLIAVCGGATLYVPMESSPDHAIAKIVGPAAFRNLSDAFGGETIDLPEADDFKRLRRVRRVAFWLAKGYRVSEIAKELGISARQVANYRAQAEELALLPMVFGGKNGAGQMELLVVPDELGD